MEPETQDSQMPEIQDSQVAASETANPEAAAVGQLTTPPGESPSFGWNSYAERINGRFAMIGFVALLILEFFTRQDFFTWLGF